MFSIIFFLSFSLYIFGGKLVLFNESYGFKLKPVHDITIDDRGTENPAYSKILEDLARIAGKPIHNDITSSAFTSSPFDFLISEAFDAIMYGHEFSDLLSFNQDNPHFHFDNCEFTGSIKHINGNYQNLLNLISSKQSSKLFNNHPNDHNGALEKFGEVLHTAQDFYAHTNWVEIADELKFGVTQDTLIDPGFGLWSDLTPGKLIDKTKVMTIQNHPNLNFPLTRDLQSHLVIVDNPSDNIVGLISGVAANPLNPGGFGSCPPNIALGHWDPYFLNGDISDLVDIGTFTPEITKLVELSFIGRDLDNPIKSIFPKLRNIPGITGLNKDDTSRNFAANLHEKAKDFAFKQTKHEWCRLVSLVAERDGKDGVDFLLDNIVLPTKKEQSLSLCNFHPPIADAGDPQSVTSNKVALDGSKSVSPDNKKLKYKWTIIDPLPNNSNTRINLVNDDTSRPIFFTQQLQSVTTLQFLLSVTDGIYTSNDITSVTINPLDGEEFIVNSNDDTQPKSNDLDPWYI